MFSTLMNEMQPQLIIFFPFYYRLCLTEPPHRKYEAEQIVLQVVLRFLNFFLLFFLSSSR